MVLNGVLGVKYYEYYISVVIKVYLGIVRFFFVHLLVNWWDFDL